MKFYNLNYKNSIIDFDDKRDKFTAECLDGLNILIELENKIRDEQLDGYDLLLALEEFTMYPFPETIKLFKDNVCGNDDNQNRRAFYTIENYTKLTRMIEPYCIEFRPLTDKEKENVSECIAETVSHLSSLCYYFLEFNLIAYAYESGVPEECPYEVYRYAQTRGIDLKELAFKVRKVRFDHRSTLAVLDEYPEMKDQFYDRIGCGGEDLEEIEEYLTLKDVTEFLASDMDSDMFIIEIKERAKQRK